MLTKKIACKKSIFCVRILVLLLVLPPFEGFASTDVSSSQAATGSTAHIENSEGYGSAGGSRESGFGSDFNSSENLSSADADASSEADNPDNASDRSPESKLQNEKSSDSQKTTDGEAGAQTQGGSTSSSSSEEPVATPTASGAESSFSSVKLDPQINTGTATTSIPIEVPPGRKDMAPKLSINYSSDQSNGWIGVGWMLDVGAIQRETKWGLDYNADDYVFAINDSNSELVPRIDWGTDYYGAKIEGEFSKYFYNSATNGWEVTAKNGTKYYFGSVLDSRQYDPADVNRIFKWCLDRVEDTNGNYMEISYQKFDNEIYLDEIRYTGNTAGLPTTNSVKFYLEPRTDAYEVYTSHFSVTTAYRLEAIEVYGDGQLARTYEFAYNYSPGTLRSLLASVTLYGSNGNPLPPITFTYTDMSYAFSDSAIQWHTTRIYGYDGYSDYFTYIRNERDYSTSSYPPKWYISDILDMNGDARPDRLAPLCVGVDSSCNYLRMYGNSGDGFNMFGVGLNPSPDKVLYTDVKPPGYLNTFVTDTFMDMNGDGLPDRVTMGGEDYLNVYMNNGYGTTFDPAVQWNTPITNSNWTQGVSNSYGGSTIQANIDINGDGLPDRVTSPPSKSGGYFLVYLNTGDGFSDTAEQWNAPSSGGDTYITLNAGHGTLADMIDMNGDGLLDRVKTSECCVDNILVYLNTGSDISNTPIQWYQDTSAGSEMLTENDTDGISKDIIDMNGDGLPDKVVKEGGGGSDLLIYLNTGSGFTSSAVRWHSPVAGIKDFDSIGNITQNLMDMNGDGILDKVISPVGMQDYLLVYPAQGQVPDLLMNIDNGLGGTTEIEYTPSTQYNNTYLPFVKQVVSGVTVRDGKGNLSVTTFDYASGYYNADEKEFRGFEYVKSTAPNGTITETWFHQDDIFKGLIDAQVISGSDGNYYTWTQNVYESTIPYTGIDYPYLAQKDDYIYDGDSCSEPRHIINQFTYDGYGNITSKYYAENPLKGDEKTEYTEYLYDMDNWIVSLPSTKYVADSNSIIQEQTWYTYYDGSVNLKTRDDWLDAGDNPVTVFTYDDYGNVKTIVDPNINPPTIITYDTATHTYPVTIQNPKGHTIQMTYNTKYGKLATKTDANDKTITYDYDEFGRLVKITNPAPYGITEYSYENYGDPYTQKVREEAKDQSGTLMLFKETYFDGLGRTTSEQQGGPGAQTIIIDTEYNNKGLEYKKSLPYYAGDTVYKMINTYDPVDRLIQTVNPDNTVTKTSYMKGRVTYIDANGHKKVAEKDIYERIIKIEEYSGEAPSFNLYATTVYSYDVMGNLTYVRDEQGNETFISYDSLSRKISMDDPDMGFWEYDYDANGNLIWQKDAKQQEITFDYDELDRIEKKTYPDATFIEYIYDEPFATNPIGRLTTLNDLSGSTKHYYDALGQLTRLDKAIDTTTYTTQTEYDELGRVKKIIYPDYAEVDYTYDGNGNIFDISSGTQTYVTYNSYTANRNPLLITYGNQVTTEYQYYPENNRLFSITTNSPSAGGLMNLAYYYDDVGNITKIEDLLDSSKTRDYKYDDFDRLIEADSPSYGGKLIYQYDKIGNMSYNCRYGYYEYDPDHPHAVKRIVKNQQVIEQYEYDDNGNMISGAGREFTYDYDNMPTSITYNSAATISVYDAYGMRAKKVTPVSTTRYVGQMYECENGECSKYIFANIQRIASVKTADTYYYHSDHLATNSVITKADASVGQEIYYYPYGEIKSSTGTIDVRHKYTDKEWDAETGLYYFGARYYDPKLAKFTSADTIVPLPFHPQTFNRYSYTYNNPLVFRDLEGHCAGAIMSRPTSATNPTATNTPPPASPVQTAQQNSTPKAAVGSDARSSQPTTQNDGPTKVPGSGAMTDNSGKSGGPSGDPSRAVQGGGVCTSQTETVSSTTPDIKGESNATTPDIPGSEGTTGEGSVNPNSQANNRTIFGTIVQWIRNHGDLTLSFNLISRGRIPLALSGEITVDGDGISGRVGAGLGAGKSSIAVATGVTGGDGSGWGTSLSVTGGTGKKGGYVTGTMYSSGNASVAGGALWGSGGAGGTFTAGYSGQIMRW